MNSRGSLPSQNAGNEVEKGTFERCPGIGAVDSDSIQLIQQPKFSETADKIGAVEAPTAPIGFPQQLADSPTFQAMEGRLSESALIASINDQRSLYHLEQELTAILSGFTQAHRLTGLMIASADGLVIAKSERLKQEPVLAALAALCDGVCARVRQESILASVDEITLRARNGSRLTIRGFLGPEERLLLVALSPHALPLWITDEVIRKCRELLKSFLCPLSAQEIAAHEQTRHPIWRRVVRHFLAPLSTSTLLD